MHQQLANELHNSTIKKLKKLNVFSSFMNNIKYADLADLPDVQLISKCKKEIHFSLHVFDVFIKYAWVIQLKDKKRCYDY